MDIYKMQFRQKNKVSTIIQMEKSKQEPHNRCSNRLGLKIMTKGNSKTPFTVDLHHVCPFRPYLHKNKSCFLNKSRSIELFELAVKLQVTFDISSYKCFPSSSLTSLAVLVRVDGHVPFSMPLISSKGEYFPQHRN